jgi:hypothetical protein
MRASADEVPPAAAPAARTGETLGPALLGQIFLTLRLVSKLEAELVHRHNAFSLQAIGSVHSPTISPFVRLIKLDIHLKLFNGSKT